LINIDNFQKLPAKVIEARIKLTKVKNLLEKHLEIKDTSEGLTLTFF